MKELIFNIPMISEERENTEISETFLPLSPDPLAHHTQTVETFLPGIID